MTQSSGTHERYRFFPVMRGQGTSVALLSDLSAGAIDADVPQQDARPTHRLVQIQRVEHVRALFRQRQRRRRSSSSVQGRTTPWPSHQTPQHRHVLRVRPAQQPVAFSRLERHGDGEGTVGEEGEVRKFKFPLPKDGQSGLARREDERAGEGVELSESTRLGSRWKCEICSQRWRASGV
nr:hypothetical protein CFP56_31672 [Quercus suber]